MQAWRLDTSGARLVWQEVPTPSAAPGEALIEVHAAGVTPTELRWYPTTHTRAGQPRLRAIPGHEFAGRVAALGPGTVGLEVGEEVFGMNDWFVDGATAEYCTAQPAQLAAKPRRLSFAEAASVPIGALTAWQGLHDRARLMPGETVLVHGAAGAVGIFAVQLARLRGARVIATASAGQGQFLRDLGVERVIDYRVERFEQHVSEIDVVFDGVGGETLERSWKALSARGRLVTIAASEEGSGDTRAKQAFFIVEPNRNQLMEIAALLDRGQLVTVVDAQTPLSRADEAYAGTLEGRLGRGKRVVVREP